MRTTASPIWLAVAALYPLFGAATMSGANAATPLWRLPLESLSETRERPLFSRTRRPPPPPASVAPVVMAPTPQPEPLRVSLLGVVSGPSEQAVAVLREDESQTVKRLQVGDILNRWTLIEVRRREVLFKRDQEIVTLEMPKPGAQRSDAPVTGFPPPGPFPMPMPTPFPFPKPR